MSNGSPSVFISYAHESEHLRALVLDLSERLRTEGITTQLDQYVAGTPETGWSRWMMDQVDWAEYVLLVCTETYYQRFRGHELPGQGKGVDFEGLIMTQEILDARSATRKFVPVVFDPRDEVFIPEPVRAHTHYVLTTEPSLRSLCDFLLGQAGVEPGSVRVPKRRPIRRGVPLILPDGKRLEEERVLPGGLEPSGLSLSTTGGGEGATSPPSGSAALSEAADSEAADSLPFSSVAPTSASAPPPKRGLFGHRGSTVERWQLGATYTAMTLFYGFGAAAAWDLVEDKSFAYTVAIGTGVAALLFLRLATQNFPATIRNLFGFGGAGAAIMAITVMTKASTLPTESIANAIPVPTFPDAGATNGDIQEQTQISTRPLFDAAPEAASPAQNADAASVKPIPPHPPHPRCCSVAGVGVDCEKSQCSQCNLVNCQ